MKPMFSIHAGEFLVGDHVESQFPQLRVWVPSRDTGIDLLVTDSAAQRTTSLQVKASRDYLPTHVDPQFRNDIAACGWWNFNRAKLAGSAAEYWVLVLIGLNHTRTDFLVVPPSELLSRLQAIHGDPATLRTYFWVTKSRRCFETRGLGKPDLARIAAGEFEDPMRDVTSWLNNWKCLDMLSAGVGAPLSAST